MSSSTSSGNYDQLIQTLIGKLSAGQKFMIYGAYGYTGELIVKLVKKFNLLNRVVLAGRSEGQLKSLIKRLQIENSVEYQVFGLDDKNLDEQIGKVDLVMLVAGPFAYTSKRVVDSCLRTGVHYIDITGEYTVFQSILENEACKIAAKQKNIILMPGVGFDVVPTDCLAKSLQEAYDKKYGEGACKDDKAQIELAINTGKSGMSRGTTKSAVNMMKEAPWGFPERVNHKIGPHPLVAKDFEFYDEKTKQTKPLTCMSVPWGDIATAYSSTQVPNIRVYFTSSKNAPTVARIYNIWFVTILFFLFFNLPFVVPLIFKAIDTFMPKGPEETENDRVHISGTLTCGDKKVSGRAVTKAGYLFTAESALLSALKIITGYDLKIESGALTPSLCFGSQFVKQIDSCNVEIL